MDSDVGFLAPSRRDMYKLTIPLFDDIVVECNPDRVSVNNAARDEPSLITDGTPAFTMVGDVINVYGLTHTDSRVDCMAMPEICVKVINQTINFHSQFYVTVYDDFMRILVRLHLSDGTYSYEMAGKDGRFSVMELDYNTLLPEGVAQVPDHYNHTNIDENTVIKDTVQRKSIIRSSAFRVDIMVLYTAAARVLHGVAACRSFCDETVNIVRIY